MPRLEIVLQPKQNIFERALHKYPVVFYGGSKGGGKSVGLRRVLLLRRFEFPGSRGVIFRRTYQELEDNHIGPMLTEFPEIRPYYNSAKHQLRFPGLESELLFRYCKKEADVIAHQGVEYNDLGIEEAGQWTEWMFWRLMGSNRSGRADIPARAALTGNPGGLGHQWLKRLFISKRLKPHEIAAGFRTEDFHFVPARVYDNAAIMQNDPAYVARLKAEPNEQLRKAYLDGSWDIQAGQFFSEFSREIHVVPQFQVPLHWEWFGAYDYGFGHPASWGWYAADTQGNVVRVRSLCKAQMPIDLQAREVHAIEDQLVKSKQKRSRQTTFWAGRDCWSTKKAGDPTIAEDFMSARVVEKNLVYLKPANISRRQGASQLRSYLRHEMREDAAGRPYRWGPRFTIMDTPENEVAIDALTRMVTDPSDVEDVLKVDATEGDPFTGDDAYDELRYGLMSRPVAATEPRKARGTTYNEDTSHRRASWQTV